MVVRRRRELSAFSLRRFRFSAKGERLNEILRLVALSYWDHRILKTLVRPFVNFSILNYLSMNILRAFAYSVV